MRNVVVRGVLGMLLVLGILLLVLGMLLVLLLVLLLVRGRGRWRV